MMKSSVPVSGSKFGGFVLSTKALAPSFVASRSLPGDLLKTVTCAPIARAIFTAMWPRPPIPTTPTRLPLPILYRLRGE